jgi:hypothetical protein
VGAWLRVVGRIYGRRCTRKQSRSQDETFFMARAPMRERADRLFSRRLQRSLMPLPPD